MACGDGGTCAAGQCAGETLRCGDGIVGGGEGCDDSNTLAGDGCDASCLIELDGKCEHDYQCASGVCSSLGGGSCVVASTCGNGVVEWPEGCDMGDVLPGDGCNEQCLFEDGGPCDFQYQCASGVCNATTCAPANVCGNGLLEPGEYCDDGNIVGGDGCSMDCGIEVGGTCITHVSCQSGVCDLLDTQTCVAAGECGNSFQESMEGCDDGNTVAGDGCDENCLVELGSSCRHNLDCQNGFCLGSCFDPPPPPPPTLNAQEAAQGANGDNVDNVAISGSLAAFSVPLEDSCVGGVQTSEASDNNCMSSGAVIALTRAANGTWSFDAFIKGNANTVAQFFGDSIAMSGTRLVVGTFREYVRIFNRTTGSWKGEKTLTADNAQNGDLFGKSVDVDGDVLVVGAPGEDACSGTDGSDNGCLGAGAAYVFRKTADMWIQEGYLKASNAGVDDNFGDAVAISGDDVIVGAPGEDACAKGVDGTPTTNGCADAGAAYVFEYGAGIWQQTAYLKATNTNAGDGFGFDVDISDSGTAVVTAPDEDSCARAVDGVENNNNCNLAGAAYTYIFDPAAGVWSPESYLKPSNLDANDRFGSSVSIQNNAIAIGAKGEDSDPVGQATNPYNNGTSNAGAVYIFVRTENGWPWPAWAQTNMIKNEGYSSNFGLDIDSDGTGWIVGASHFNNIGRVAIFSSLP